jgi:hypothetical protein
MMNGVMLCQNIDHYTTKTERKKWLLSRPPYLILVYIELIWKIIAQKYLHDAIYTLTTWSDIVCKHRPDLDAENLYATERLILSYISWRTSIIARDDVIHAGVVNAHEEASAAYHRYSRYLPVTMTKRKLLKMKVKMLQ